MNNSPTMNLLKELVEHQGSLFKDQLASLSTLITRQLKLTGIHPLTGKGTATPLMLLKPDPFVLTAAHKHHSKLYSASSSWELAESLEWKSQLAATEICSGESMMSLTSVDSFRVDIHSRAVVLLASRHCLSRAQADRIIHAGIHGNPPILIDNPPVLIDNPPVLINNPPIDNPPNDLNGLSHSVGLPPPLVASLIANHERIDSEEKQLIRDLKRDLTRQRLKRKKAEHRLPDTTVETTPKRLKPSLEEKLSALCDSSGAVSDHMSIQPFLDLMREATSREDRSLLCGVLQASCNNTPIYNNNTPQYNNNTPLFTASSASVCLRKLISMDILQVIRGWLEEAKARADKGLLRIYFKMLKSLPVTVTALAKTGIGKTVSRLRKDQDIEIKSPALEVFSVWSKIVQLQTIAEAGRTVANPAADRTVASPAADKTVASPATDRTVTSPAASTVTQDGRNQRPIKHQTITKPVGPLRSCNDPFLSQLGASRPLKSVIQNPQSTLQKALSGSVLDSKKVKSLLNRRVDGSLIKPKGSRAFAVEQIQATDRTTSSQSEDLRMSTDFKKKKKSVTWAVDGALCQIRLFQINDESNADPVIAELTFESILGQAYTGSDQRFAKAVSLERSQERKLLKDRHVKSFEEEQIEEPRTLAWTAPPPSRYKTVQRFTAGAESQEKLIRSTYVAMTPPWIPTVHMSAPKDPYISAGIDSSPDSSWIPAIPMDETRSSSHSKAYSPSVLQPSASSDDLTTVLTLLQHPNVTKALRGFQPLPPRGHAVPPTPPFPPTSLHPVPLPPRPTDFCLSFHSPYGCRAGHRCDRFHDLRYPNVLPPNVRPLHPPLAPPVSPFSTNYARPPPPYAHPPRPWP